MRLWMGVGTALAIVAGWWALEEGEYWRTGVLWFLAAWLLYLYVQRLRRMK